jgi:hypothetical protein
MQEARAQIETNSAEHLSKAHLEVSFILFNYFNPPGFTRAIKYRILAFPVYQIRIFQHLDF